MTFELAFAIISLSYVIELDITFELAFAIISILLLSYVIELGGQVHRAANYLRAH